MSIILPISDLRNYTQVLDQVDAGRPVYLTRNGRGAYVITKIDDYQPEATVEDLVNQIKKGERLSQNDAPKSLEALAKQFGVDV